MQAAACNQAVFKVEPFDLTRNTFLPTFEIGNKIRWVKSIRYNTERKASVNKRVDITRNRLNVLCMRHRGVGGIFGEICAGNFAL